MKKSARSTTEFDTKVGKIIRNTRIEQGMSMEELAAKIGTSYQQLCKYEHGSSRVSIERMTLIAKALERSITEFCPKENVIYNAGKNRVIIGIMKSIQAMDSKQKNIVRDFVVTLGGEK